MKIGWYWQKNRHMINEIKLKTLTLIHKPMNTWFLTKKPKLYNGKKESIFNKWCWHNWLSTCRRMQIDPYLSPCTRVRSKWINDLIINLVTLNLTEEKVRSSLEPVAQTLRVTINKWDLLKLRNFWKAKDTVTKTKQQPAEWEKIFTNSTSDRELISKI